MFPQYVTAVKARTDPDHESRSAQILRPHRGSRRSTSLMDCLAQYPDIAVPNKNIACIDHELTHPARIQAHAAAYAELCGRAITTPEQLIECFFEINSEAAFAGFKTMPTGTRISAALARSDIQFVTLRVAIWHRPLASFLVAMLPSRGGVPGSRRLPGGNSTCNATRRRYWATYATSCAAMRS